MILLKSLISETSWPKNLSKVWAFWLSPEGELFEVPDDGGHDYMARDILKKRYKITFDEDRWYNNDLRQIMYDKNWKDISPVTIKSHNCIFVSPAKFLTSSQKQTLEKMAMDTNRSVFYDDRQFTPIFVLPDNNPFNSETI